MSKMNLIAVVVLALLLNVLSATAQSCTKTVTIAWTIPPSKTAVFIQTGQCIKFTKSSSSNHDLLKFSNLSRYSACNFSGAKTIAAYGNGAPAWSAKTVSFATAGTFYYGCSVSGHCSGGQKIKVTVTNASRNLRRRWDVIQESRFNEEA